MTPRLKNWLLTQQQAGGLPAGYTELEYLESSGTQSIYASDEVTPESGFEMQYQQIAPFESYVNPWLIGRYWEDEAYRRISLGAGPSNRSDIQSVFFTNYSTLPDALVSLKIDAENDSIYVVSINKNNDSVITIVCAGATVVGVSTMFPYLSAPETPIIGQEINRNGVSERKADPGRCFWMKMYRSGSLLRSFIPVLDKKGTPCMFDLVSRKPYYNSGTGTFGYRIKTSGETIAPFARRDPYYTAPSGVYARPSGENELEILADTDIAADAAEQAGYTWHPNTGDAYTAYNITPSPEITA